MNKMDLESLALTERIKSMTQQRGLLLIIAKQSDDIRKIL